MPWAAVDPQYRCGKGRLRQPCRMTPQQLEGLTIDVDDVARAHKGKTCNRAAVEVHPGSLRDHPHPHSTLAHIPAKHGVCHGPGRLDIAVEGLQKVAAGRLADKLMPARWKRHISRQEGPGLEVIHDTCQRSS